MMAATSRLASISSSSPRNLLLGLRNSMGPCFCRHDRMTFQTHGRFKLGLILSVNQFSSNGHALVQTRNVTRWSQRHRGKDGSSSDSVESEEKISKADKRQFKKKVRPGSSGSPTVFHDALRIFVKAGHGGRGLLTKGGIGGRGGDVILVGHKDMTLKRIIDMHPSKRFTADQGLDAKLFCLYGEQGKNVLLPVPLGVSVVTELGHTLGEINTHAQKLVVAKGGMGGSPRNEFMAELGQKHNIQLNLKLIADVGFVGFPNAGKSTLLKAISRARPRIASYPFTTIRPNIGVIEYGDFRTISLADLPGLIEGAHINIGMGHNFLKHIERTKVLLFVVDIHGFQLRPEYARRSAMETIVLLNKELELYKEELTEKPAILVMNKTDLPGSYEILNQVRDILGDQKSYESFLKTLPEEFWPNNIIMFDDIVPISAATDPISVKVLQRKIRQIIDVNANYNEHENELITTNNTSHITVT